MYRDDLAKLSKDELIARVLAQAAQIEELTRRIGELEARLGGPPKSPDNSSLPPSQGRKPNRAERRAAKKRMPNSSSALPSCHSPTNPARPGTIAIRLMFSGVLSRSSRASRSTSSNGNEFLIRWE